MTPLNGILGLLTLIHTTFINAWQIRGYRKESKYPISDKKSLRSKSWNMGIKNSYLNFRCRAKLYINLKIISLLKWREQRTGI